MTVADSLDGASRSLADAVGAGALKFASVIWYLTAVGGQWLFALYIFGSYGAAPVVGHFAQWHKRLHEGDLWGNIAFGVHMLLALVITVGGPIQLIPQIRNYAPIFHHWNGRVYLLTALVISMDGLYMVWERGIPGGLPNQVAFTLNAALIVFFAIMAVHNAVARDIDTHRRWALRLFLAVSGVWFFRVGLMAWIIVNHGPLWSTKSLDGPFDYFLAFANYLLPLAVLELYLRTQDRAGPAGKFAMATALLGLTGLMAVGIFGAAAFIWLPHLTPS